MQTQESCATYQLTVWSGAFHAAEFTATWTPVLLNSAYVYTGTIVEEYEGHRTPLVSLELVSNAQIKMRIAFTKERARALASRINEIADTL